MNIALLTTYPPRIRTVLVELRREPCASCFSPRQSVIALSPPPEHLLQRLDLDLGAQPVQRHAAGLSRSAPSTTWNRLRAGSERTAHTELPRHRVPTSKAGRKVKCRGLSVGGWQKRRLRT